MKRSPIRRETPLKRATPLKRGEPLKRTAAQRTWTTGRWRKGIQPGEMCFCGCGQPAVQAHHLISVGTCLRYGASTTDTRNRAPVAASCHANHHLAARRFPLPDRDHPVWEFAAEHGMGWYLLRYYAWPDSRFGP